MNLFLKFFISSVLIPFLEIPKVNNYCVHRGKKYYNLIFFRHKIGFRYIYSSFFFAKNILRVKKPLDAPINTPELSVHVVCGTTDLVNLLWSLASYFNVSNVIGKLYIHDDGSFTQEDTRTINRLFPSATIINGECLFASFRKEVSQHKTINEFRTIYRYKALLKKIIDPYFLPNKMHLIIDSDLLWLSKPTELEKEIKNGCKKSFMMKNNKKLPLTLTKNINDDYGWMNSGIVLYAHENFNLHNLNDFWSLIDKENSKSLHFAEQSGFAKCLKNLKALPQNKYFVRSIHHQETDESAVIHYTNPKRAFFYVKLLQLKHLLN